VRLDWDQFGFNYGNGVVANFGYSADRLQLTSLCPAPNFRALEHTTFRFLL
jgi:hypothetical protein